MKVEIWNERAAWDTYVESCPDASSYHRWMWREAIEQTFGHRPYYLVAGTDGCIQGVLPLFHMRSRLFGNSLVSMPFFSYGGILASAPEAREQLLRRAAELARELKVRHVELRYRDAAPIGWVEATPKVTMEVPLPATADELWKRLSTGMRNKIRNAKKNDLQVEWTGAEAVDEFYRVFSRNMRDLGSPVYPRAWFENLCRCAPNDTGFIVLRDAGQAIAAGIITKFRDTVELPWSAALQESRKKYTAVLMYWSVFEWAIEHGFRRVDLGRCTRGGGTWEFKRHWNPEEKTLHWYYWLADGAEVPALRPDNPRFRLATRVWQRLPVAVANTLGPRISCSIP
ncbi:MAG: FemAB family XrtA/PEP-CTERM system-associated protein [Terriglobales bacterium]